MRILPQMYQWARKNWLNLGSHPPPDPRIQGFLKASSTLWKMAFFCNSAHVFGNWSDLHENFITSLDKEVPVNFWKSSGSWMGPIRPDALSECSCLGHVYWCEHERLSGRQSRRICQWHRHWLECVRCRRRHHVVTDISVGARFSCLEASTIEVKF